MNEDRRFPRVQTEIMERAWQRADRKVAATLIRTAQDYAQGDASHRSVVWLRHLIDQIDDFVALMALADQLPEHTLALRELAALANGRIKDVLTELAASEPDFLPLLATARNNLTTRLSALGRREPALAAAEEAAALCRELAAQQPEVFRSNLAVALAVKGNCLDALGRAADALAANVEAIATLSPVFVEQPAAFGHWMAPMSGNTWNVASVLDESRTWSDWDPPSQSCKMNKCQQRRARMSIEPPQQSGCLPRI